MSEKSAAQKLGMKAGKVLLVRLAPTEIERLLGDVPVDAEWTQKGAGPFPLMLVFVKDRAQMEKELPKCRAKLADGGALWIAYAKGTSSKATDIHRDTIREYVETIGLTTVAAIAIDADWSALRLKVA